MEDLKEKLKSDQEIAKWPMLEEHHKREALLVASEDLDLLDVAVAIAKDEVQLVKGWLDSEKLKRPDDEMLKLFEDEIDQDFRFVIIQPYVLAQIIKED